MCVRSVYVCVSVYYVHMLCSVYPVCVYKVCNVYIYIVCVCSMCMSSMCIMYAMCVCL